MFGEKEMKTLHCLSTSVITALLMAISVFIANVSHTEYKSQMRKRKLKKTEIADRRDQTELVLEDNTMTDTNV